MPKVMIVDDEPEIVDLFDLFFKKHGFDVVRCVGGEQAVDVIDSDDFENVDLIILDRRMPKVDGPAIIEHLQKENKRGKVSVVMLTGSYSEEVRGLDVDELLMKPVNLKLILEKVNQLLEKSA